ncbi:MAG: sulfate/molybdate ABC transporter ATP-binding protein [Nitrospinota bacterium]
MLEFDFEKTFHLRGEPDFHIEAADSMGQELTVLFGPSGSGKSTLLNMLAGIVRPDRGRAVLQGKTIFHSQRRIDLPLRERRIGYVFQDLALFPHLTVLDNIAYGIPNGKPKGSLVRELISQFGLESQEGKYPPQLSGGQRQRVAIARTLAAEPSLLMMDEPISALDEPTREQFLWDISALKERFAVPTLYVTHNLREAYSLADRVVVIDRGMVIEKGPKGAILERPAKYRTAQCVGIENLFPCRVVRVETGEMTVRLGSMELALNRDARFAPGETAYLGISPPDVRVSAKPENSPNTIRAAVRSVMERKNILVVHLDTLPDGPMLVADLRKRTFPKWGIESGPPVFVSLAKDALFLCEE